VHGDSGRTARWDQADGWTEEDEALLDARARADDFGCGAIAAGQGAALRFMATALRARAVVEIGTGTGVSGLWLLRGMAPDGVLTSIDVEPEYQRAARAAFLAEGYPPGRLRLINGTALDVLPRLADGAYDLVLADAILVEYPRYLDEAVRLLRPGGVLAMTGVPARVPEPVGRVDPESQAIREVVRACREDEHLVSLPLPVGDGLLLAARAL
jgi:predicted O-methyltransferase YrrM